MAGRTCDLVVIGAGPGGYAAAARAADLGLKVVCVDRGWLGGTCLQAGCIPSKALLEASHRWAELKEGLDDHGILVGDLRLDLAAMMKHKQGIVGRMTKGVASLFKSKGVEYVEGEARLAAAGRVSVEGAGQIEASRVLLATGSSPAELPDLPFDGQRILSSQEALSLDAVPERMAVIGAGAIGLEMGSVWSRLGGAVEVVEYLDAVLPGADGEISRQLERTLKRQGLKFHLSARATGAETCDSGVRLHLEARKGERTSTVECDYVLVAVGRRPHTEGLGLEEAGVDRDRSGFVTVDEDYRTSVDGIYAIGDVTPRTDAGPQGRGRGRGRRGAHGRPGIERQLRGHPQRGVHPPGGRLRGPHRGAGPRSRARGAHRPLFLPRQRPGPHHERPRGLCQGGGRGRGDRLLGVHILGAQASHLIAEAVVALEFGASAEDLARTVHAHPSLSEVVREAAAAVGG